MSQLARPGSAVDAAQNVGVSMSIAERAVLEAKMAYNNLGYDASAEWPNISARTIASVRAAYDHWEKAKADLEYARYMAHRNYPSMEGLRPSFEPANPALVRKRQA